jgi:hypothetical protein
MGRKKTEKKPMITPTETETKPVRLDLPPDIHRMLRLIAADDNVSMATCARNCVERYLREEMKRRGFKP